MEVFLSFAVGALSALILAFVFSLGLKGFARLIVNLLVGFAVLAVLAFTGVMPFNAINAFIVGLLGVPGLLAVLVIVLWA